MRTSQTAVLERLADLTGEFTTEPFEVGWAAEARFFIRVLDRPDGDSTMSVTVQVSPDGLVWCDHETPSIEVRRQDLATIPLTGFGGWIRLKGKVSDDATWQTLIYLHLKS